MTFHVEQSVDFAAAFSRGFDEFLDKSGG